MMLKGELIDEVNLHDIAYDQEYSEDGDDVGDLLYSCSVNPEAEDYIDYTINDDSGIFRLDL